jgi:hypothetical protein
MYYTYTIKREEKKAMKKTYVVMCGVCEGIFSLAKMASEVEAKECVMYMTANDPSARYWYEVREGA